MLDLQQNRQYIEDDDTPECQFDGTGDDTPRVLCFSYGHTDEFGSGIGQHPQSEWLTTLTLDTRRSRSQRYSKDPGTVLYRQCHTEASWRPGPSSTEILSDRGLVRRLISVLAKGSEGLRL